METVVSKEQAQKEVNDWLDRMEIPATKRDSDEVSFFIESIINSVMGGWLIFNEDGTVTQKLKYPLADGATKELRHSFRYQIGEYNKAMKGLHPSEEVDWCMAKLLVINANSPKMPRAALDKLDGADFKVSKALTVFF